MHEASPDREHAIDLGQRGKEIPLEVSHILGENCHQSLQLRLLHRLNNELVVMAEEKEAAAFARAFPRAKHLLTIKARAQTEFQQTDTKVVRCEQVREEIHVVERDREISVYGSRALLLLLLG